VRPTPGIDLARARALLADHSRPLADVARELGHPTYDAFRHWCQHHLGAGPRELRTGARYRGAPPSAEQTATALYQVRCTPAEKREISAAVRTLAEREGLTHAAALARVLAEAVARGVKHRSKKKWACLHLLS